MDVDQLARYARLLGRVFPLGRNKKPLRGSHPKADAVEATIDVIGQLLDRHTVYGIYLREQVALLDVDCVSALEHVRRLGLPRTVVVKSSRGYHLPFADPTGTLRGKIGFLSKVDLAAHEGSPWYVVGPGSRHPDGPIYEIIDGLDVLASGALPPAPEWLYERQRELREQAQLKRVQAQTNRREDAAASAVVFTGAVETQRHDALRQFAVRRRYQGASDTDLLQECEMAADRCVPPLRDRPTEVAEIVGWVVDNIPMPPQDLHRQVSQAVPQSRRAAWRAPRERGQDILDIAIAYARQWPVDTEGSPQWRQLLATLFLLGTLPDPVFAFPQLRVAKALGCGSQGMVCHMLKKAVALGLLIYEDDTYVPGRRAITYRLAARAAEPRTARLSSAIGDDEQVRVVWHDRQRCYRLIPVVAGERGAAITDSSPDSAERKALSRLRAAGTGLTRAHQLREGYIEPEVEDIEAWRAAAPYAGPDTDFIGVSMGELRDRIDGLSLVKTMPPPVEVAPAVSASAMKPVRRRPRDRSQQRPPTRRRAWESGTREPFLEPSNLRDSRQPHEPLQPWAWEGLEDFVKPICAFSFRRADLIEVLRRVWPAIKDRPRIGLDLALALDAIVKRIAAGETHTWRENRFLCDQVRLKIAPEAPDRERVFTEAGWGWTGLERPTLHIAVAILTAHNLITVDEIREIQAHGRSQAITSRPRRWGAWAATDVPGSTRADTWPHNYTFTPEELRMILAMEQFPLWRVRSSAAADARWLLSAELKRMCLPLTAIKTGGRFARRNPLQPLTMTVYDAIAVLSAKGAGLGLGRKVQEAPPACAA